MSSAWRPFVPEPVIRLLLNRPGRVPAPLVERIDAAVLVSDIAGFTAMSEALARTGRQGAEELNQILNGCFGPMIDQIGYYGGTVVQFAGDSVTAVFGYEPRTRGAILRRAVQCGLDMQEAMGSFQETISRAGMFRLAMRVGLGAGSLLGVILGDPSARLAYVVMGPALEQATMAERQATAGEVAVAQDMLEAGLGIELARRRDGVGVVAGMRRRAGRAPARPIVDADGMTSPRLASFLHPAIAERVQAGRRGLVDEHRCVTVAFVGFPRLPIDHPRAVAAMQTFVAAAVSLIGRYGGHLNQVDTGGKGNLLMICFGTPVGHEDDEERAVACCLELLRRPSGPFRAGIATGFVYCGEVGSEARREYTVVGDSVNLAARLLEAAGPGQLLIDGPTHEKAAESAILERLEPITVKGKLGPIDVWTVRTARESPGLRLQEPAHPGPLVGREAETEAIGRRIGLAQAGRGQVLSLVGEAGIGKSRLATEAVRMAEARGFVAYGGASRSYGTSTGYLIWRPIWRAILELDDGTDAAEQRERLVARLARGEEGSGQRAPLLEPVLRLAIPENALTASLDPPVRDGLLRSLLLDCLRERTAEGPVLLVLEDCHWIDTASMELLEFLARNVADLPVVVLATARAAGAGPSPLASLARLAHGTEVRLRELQVGDCERLATQLFASRFGTRLEPSGEVVGQVAERAAGNPFYVRELVELLHAGGVVPADPGSLASVELPDSLHRLVLARLDQLSEGEQATIKVASVIGRVFPAHWIGGSYPQVGPAGEVLRHLERLDALDLTPLHSSSPEPEYGFKHAIIQEVAYGSLAFGVREVLHEGVAGFIERSYADRLAQYVDLLAHHYGRTRNLDKQRVWFRAAGDAAKAAFANQAAVDHYERLLPLLSEQQAGEVLLELGAVWQLTGRWTDAERAYIRAMRAAERTSNERTLAASRRDLGVLAMHTRSSAEAVRWLGQAAADFERLDDPVGLSRSLHHLALVLMQQGRHAEALAAAERHLAIATTVGDHGQASAALHNLGLVRWDKGEYAAAIGFLERALAAATEAGDRRGVGRVAADLAGLHAEHGHHLRAVEHLQQALEVAGEIGDRWAAAVRVGNLGELYREEGDHVRATHCFAHALGIALELGDWMLVTSRVASLAVSAAAQGHDGEAEALLDRAIGLAGIMDASFYLGECHYHLARLYAGRGRLEEAERLNEQALTVAARRDDHEILLRARVLAIRLRVALGRLGTGPAVGQLERLALANQDMAEQAAILEAIWELTPADEETRRAAAERYWALYEQAPTVGYREAYERLTGTRLPPGPPLPALPEVVAREPVDAEELLREVDLALQELRAAETS